MDAIAAHAREALPAECCGILIGSGADIVEARRAGNLAAAPGRFLVDPKDHFDARREARRRRLEVIGFYHSHPHSEPEPSPTDRAEAAYPEHLCLIVRPFPTSSTVRLFRQDGREFVEVDFQVTDSR